MPHSGIDLPDFAFGAQTTLTYAENSTDTGGALTVTDGRHAAAIASGQLHGGELPHHR